MTSTTCGWCGRVANMSRLCDAVYQAKGEFEPETYAQAHRCDHCGNILIRYGILEDETSEKWLPRAGAHKSFPDVPNEIASLAEEAHDCLSVNARRGAIVLARAVIEASAKDKGFSQGNLYTKIDNLHGAGLLREHIREAAHEVRLGGNDVAHGDILSGPLTQEEAEEVLTLMDEILAEVYQSPARVKRARDLRIKRQQSTTP
ncbi:DUF4145 domain-containing protein [Streptomyces phaeochromogenes]|uniref:DUF4145 domain-containing protein n=1 Tax=Streptomyces phaeochromogenes TaxID=1923 RepID=UPI0033ED61A3